MFHATANYLLRRSMNSNRNYISSDIQLEAEGERGEGGGYQEPREKKVRGPIESEAMVREKRMPCRGSWWSTPSSPSSLVKLRDLRLPRALPARALTLVTRACPSLSRRRGEWVAGSFEIPITSALGGWMRSQRLQNRLKRFHFGIVHANTNMRVIFSRFYYSCF